MISDGDSNAQSWQSSYVKEPQPQVWVGNIHLSGDSQTDIPNHGGANRVILAYGATNYPLWKSELDVELPYGAFAENFTVDGITEQNACIGDIYEVGDAIIQISEPRIPCWKISSRWGIKDLLQRVIETGRTGWFFRTLQEGYVEPGQSMKLIQRPYPRITVERINDALVHHKHDQENASEIAECTLLSKRVRDIFYTRID